MVSDSRPDLLGPFGSNTLRDANSADSSGLCAYHVAARPTAEDTIGSSMMKIVGSSKTGMEDKSARHPSTYSAFDEEDVFPDQRGNIEDDGDLYKDMQLNSEMQDTFMVRLLQQNLEA